MVTLPGYWEELTSPEFEALDAGTTVTVLPVAAIEQHGPHLAVASDATLNTAILCRAMATAPEGLSVLVLPMTTMGKSDERGRFPGTLTHTAETLARVWTEIGISVRRAGLRKLLLFNSHGGQPQIMQVVARRLRVEQDMFVVAANWFSWGLPADLFSGEGERHGIHAGAIQTSMMLAARPDLVRPVRFAEFAPSTITDERAFPRLHALGPASVGWEVQDLQSAGACGDARTATAEAGQRVIEHAAARLVELWGEMTRYPLDRLKRGPA